MGQRAVPFQLLQGRGAVKVDRHGTEEQQVKIEPKLPRPPKDALTAVGRAEWRRICRVLKNSRVLTDADRTVLTQYCLLYQEMLEQLQDFQAAKHTQLRMCQVELGLTPSARMRLREQS
jgi:phage terminase small subunit